jgi:hypothetical protein
MEEFFKKKRLKGNIYVLIKGGEDVAAAQGQIVED